MGFLDITACLSLAESEERAPEYLLDVIAFEPDLFQQDQVQQSSGDSFYSKQARAFLVQIVFAHPALQGRRNGFPTRRR